MSKKNQTIYNITNEIDYDKLAQAIVTAQNNQDNTKQNESDAATPFAILCSVMFLWLSILAGIFAIGFLAVVVAAFAGAYPLFFDKLPYSAFVVLVLFSFSAFFCYLFAKAYKAISVETDKGFVVSVFSSLTSFAALIIAGLTLFYTINPL